MKVGGESATAATVLMVLVAALALADSNDPGSPREVVETFYAAHFAGDMGFTTDSVSVKEKWLAPDLYTLLRAELQRPTSAGEAPFISGDPFTDTQEYPTSFRIGAVESADDTASVRVHLVLTGGSVRRVDVDLVRLEIGWRIADLFYEDGSSLRQLLCRK